MCPDRENGRGEEEILWEGEKARDDTSFCVRSVLRVQLCNIYQGENDGIAGAKAAAVSIND